MMAMNKNTQQDAAAQAMQKINEYIYADYVDIYIHYHPNSSWGFVILDFK